MKYKLDPQVYQKKLKSIQARDKVKFHSYLVELLQLAPEHNVLDLGCGHGNTLMYVVKHLNKGKAVGIDIDESLLAVAEKILEEDIDNGKLELVQGDISHKLPFENESFDRIVCHNVLECIPDKRSFLSNCYDILQPGGIMVISHCDFDTQVYNSAYPELSRRLIHNYTDTTQDWMETSDGMIGRKLFGILRKSKFKELASQIFVMENHHYRPDEYGFRIAEDIAQIARKSGKFTPEEVNRWLGDLLEQDKQDEYFYSSNTNIVIATK